MNINIKLDEDFTQALQKLYDDYGQEVAELNGLGERQLNYTYFIDNFIDKAVVADASIDSNANIGHKDIVSLENEMAKPHSKLLAFNKIFYELKKKYGLLVARRWLWHEWTGSFYLHDAHSASMKSYCFAYSLEELVQKGLFFASEFNSQPPQHLTTYTDFVAEFVSWNCNRTAGAVGLPEFLVYSFYFWRKDCQSGYAQKDNDYYRDQEFQRIIYKLNQPYLRGGIQSAFTNFSIFDREYLASLFGARKFPDGSQIIDFVEDIIEYQKAFLRILSKTRQQNMMTYPVMTYALLFQDGQFVDEDFAMFCCKHNMDWADSNFFVSSDITSLSNCCRLISNVKELGYFNSIGGTALQVGSVKVNTINLAGIAYEYTSNEYMQELRKRTKLCLQTLDVIRHIIRRNVEKGLLPNYELGIINFDKQYNTVGIIGIYECLQEYGFVQQDKFGYKSYTEEGLEFAKEILWTIHEEIDAFECDYKINIEQIPGEQAAYKLMEKDKFFHPNKIYELPLYGNQWIPLGVKCTIEDKLYISAKLDKACSGGSVAHINLDAPFENFDTAWHFLNYVANSGVPYFAFNVRISACENNHGFFGDVCPVCGGKKVTTYQRIVGFLTPETTYSEPRKREFHMRQWYDEN